MSNDSGVSETAIFSGFAGYIFGTLDSDVKSPSAFPDAKTGDLEWHFTLYSVLRQYVELRRFWLLKTVACKLITIGPYQPRQCLAGL